jgi:hypothetical protein
MQEAVKAVEVEVPGGLAQLGEHLLCKQGVVGSIPSTSTIHRIVTITPGQQSANVSQHHCDVRFRFDPLRSIRLFVL